MGDVIIYHHLGLGDHIICNGLVRYLVWSEDIRAIVPCKQHNLASIVGMYKDNANIKVVAVDNDAAVENLPKMPMLKVGFDKLDVTNCKFDEAFYNCADVPFAERWDSFHIDRDERAEMGLFNRLGLKEGEYVFVHDDPSRDYNIDVKAGLPTFRPMKSDSIFDFCYVLENAAEVHCMDSSFKHIVDSISPKGKLFYHEYVRGNTNTTTSNSKLKWNVLHFS